MQSIRQVFNVAKTKLTSDIEEKDFREESHRVFEEERKRRDLELQIWEEERQARARDLLFQQKEARAMDAEERMRRRELERLETTYLLDKVDLMERDINLQFRAQARTREANNIILSGISTVSAVLGGFVVASLVEAPLDFSNESYVPVELVYGFGISGVAAVACLLWVTVTSIVLLIHFMRQRTQRMDDVVARKIYTYAKNTFVAGILLFFAHMAFFSWVKFLFFGPWLPIALNVILLVVVVVTVLMLLEAGMCVVADTDSEPATTTAPWASEQLYSEVVMELYDDIDTHDRPEHQWGRGGRVIRRDAPHAMDNASSFQQLSPRASPRQPYASSGGGSFWGFDDNLSTGTPSGIDSPRNAYADLQEVELSSHVSGDKSADSHIPFTNADVGDGSLRQGESSHLHPQYDGSVRRNGAPRGNGLFVDPYASPASSTASSAVSSAISQTNFSRHELHHPSPNGSEHVSHEPGLAPQALHTSNGMAPTRSESFRSVSSSSTGDFAEREEGSISTSEDERAH